MEEVTVPSTGISQEVVKARINVALTAQGIFIQQLYDEAGTIVYNEDNLQSIADFIAKIKRAEKVIDEKHAEIKKPYLIAGNNCDAIKNSLKTQTGAVLKTAMARYNDLCRDIANRKRLQEQEEAREKAIIDMIDTNLIDFSSKIAMCKTSEELLAVERIINVQKSPSSAGKYGKFHAQAMQKYDDVLLPIIKAQKEKVKALEKLDADLKKAEEEGNAHKIDEIQTSQEVISNQIKHNQINVQERAISSAPIIAPVYAKEVIPDVKPRRTTWEIEVVDIREALKKVPSMLDITLNKEKAKNMLQVYKEQGFLDDKDELTVNGIRYYKKEVF